MSKTLYETANETINMLVHAINKFDDDPNGKCALIALDRAQTEIAIKALYEYICKTENSLPDERNEGEGTTTISYGEPVSDGRLDALRSVSKYLRRDIDNFAQKMNDFLDVLEETKW